jgi:hypothetical protein
MGGFGALFGVPKSPSPLGVGYVVGVGAVLGDGPKSPPFGWARGGFDTVVAGDPKGTPSCCSPGILAAKRVGVGFAVLADGPSNALSCAVLANDLNSPPVCEDQATEGGGASVLGFNPKSASIPLVPRFVDFSGGLPV